MVKQKAVINVLFFNLLILKYNRYWERKETKYEY
jgi:hypothetical protein